MPVARRCIMQQKCKCIVIQVACITEPRWLLNLDGNICWTHDGQEPSRIPWSKYVPDFGRYMYPVDEAETPVD